MTAQGFHGAPYYQFFTVEVRRSGRLNWEPTYPLGDAQWDTETASTTNFMVAEAFAIGLIDRDPFCEVRVIGHYPGGRIVMTYRANLDTIES